MNCYIKINNMHLENRYSEIPFQGNFKMTDFNNKSVSYYLLF